MAVVAASMVAVRFGGVGAAFARAPASLAWLARRCVALFAAVFRTLRTGLAGEALAPALGGEDAQQRAALLIALVSGVQVMRQMIGLPALAKADPKVLTKLLTPIVQSLLETSGKASGRQR